ncbi:MAG: carboxypeptidase-like regulatory domain-containing protein, partial [Chitinophagaceae bacterium]
MKCTFTRPDWVSSFRMHRHSIRSFSGSILLGFILLLALIGTNLTAHAHVPTMILSQRPITGTITDSATGKPLVGVTVQVKGSTIGTTTDANGHFDLEVPENALLDISYLGYRTKEILVNNTLTLNIQLSAANSALNEVVVTALGIKRQKMQLGYAVQEVKGSALTKAVEPNVMTSLTGKVAGLTVYNSSSLFASPKFTIRGATPLVVIDGVPS